MNNTPAVLNYRDLLTDIGQLYEGARQTVAETYWKIGQRLVEVEQNGAKRAKYGEKLRLHGIDTPEVTTPEGKEARDYVTRLLPPGTPVVVRSYAGDAYGRFIADILYLQEPGTFEEIASRGVFLNQELLAKGFAVRMVG